MAKNHKVVVNVATGLEDAERVTCAFLVAVAALEQGKQVAMFLTKEAIRLALPGHADAVACEGCPRSRGCSSSTPTAASCSSARSASRRAARRGRARRQRPARRRDTCGSGSARTPPSSATRQRDCAAVWRQPETTGDRAGLARLHLAT